jgi:hypothetical protein
MVPIIVAVPWDTFKYPCPTGNDEVGRERGGSVAVAIPLPDPVPKSDPAAQILLAASH